MSNEFAWGTEAVGKAINRSTRQAPHLIETRAIAFMKVGGILVAHVPTLKAAGKAGTESQGREPTR